MFREPGSAPSPVAVQALGHMIEGLQSCPFLETCHGCGGSAGPLCRDQGLLPSDCTHSLPCLLSTCCAPRPIAGGGPG